MQYASDGVQSLVDWMMMHGFEKAIKGVAHARTQMNPDRVHSVATAIRQFMRDDARLVVAAAAPGSWIFVGEMDKVERALESAKSSALNGRKVSEQTLRNKLRKALFEAQDWIIRNADMRRLPGTNVPESIPDFRSVAELITWTEQKDLPYGFVPMVREIRKLVYQPGFSESVLAEAVGLMKIREVHAQ